MPDLPTIKAPSVTESNIAMLMRAYQGLADLIGPDELPIDTITGVKPDTAVTRILTRKLESLTEQSNEESETTLDLCVKIVSCLSDPIAIHKCQTLVSKKFNVTKPALVAAIRKYISDNGAPSRTGKVSQAIQDIYYDNQRNYFRKLESGEWDAMATEQAKRHLKVECRLTDTLGDSDDYSEIDEALHMIETRQRVTTALPFPLWEDIVVQWGNSRYLNTSRCRLMTPAQEKSAGWGDRFPWVANYVDGLFYDERNKEATLGWVRSWYNNVVTNRGDGGRGLALFMVGPTGTGKTLFSHWVLGQIFGGYSDVSKMFTDNSNFNDAAFESVVWCVDDAKSLGSKETHTRFSSEVKRVVANPDYDYDKKYGYRGSVPFCGRFICTLNPGPIAIQLLPDTDLDLLDKVLLIRTSDRKCPTPDKDAIKAELPYFLAWLTQTETPAWLSEGNPRFGINPFHDQDILREAHEASMTRSYLEVVDIWRKEYGKNPTIDDGMTSQDRKSWSGTATHLLAALHREECIKGALPRSISNKSLGSHLQEAIRTGNAPWVTCKATKHGSMYTIKFD